MQPKRLMTTTCCDAKCAFAFFAEISPLEKRDLFGCWLKPHARYWFHPFPFWICRTESHLQTLVLGCFAVLFTTELCFSHKVLSKGINMGGGGSSTAVHSFHAETVRDWRFTRQRRIIKVSYVLGRAGKIRELTFLAVDINIMSQNLLNMMLQTKIRNPPPTPTPDHERTDLFGPGWSLRLADPQSNHNSWGRNSFRASPRQKTAKVKGGHRKPCSADTWRHDPGYWSTGLSDKRPHSRHSTLWQWHPGKFTKDTTCVAEWGDL